MTDYDNEGACWRNKDRKTDNHPHFTGKATINGQDYWFNVWINLGAEGNQPPIKASFQKKPKGSEIAKGAEMEALAGLMGKDTGSPPTYVPGADEELNDDIPF